MSYINPRNILNELIDSFYKMKAINVKYVDLSELTTQVYKLGFSDIKRYIYYSKQQSLEDTFNIALPIVDESSLNIYESSEQLPPTGFFSKVESNVIPKGLGIIVVEIKGYELHINVSDNRFLKSHLVFLDETHFIYDFDNQVYVQVPKEELKSTQIKLQKNGLQLQQIQDSVVRNFIEREQEFNDYLGQLKSLAIEKQQELNDLEKLKIEPHSKSEISYFLNMWKKFLDDFDTYVWLKFFYLQISLDELRLLQIKAAEFSNDVLTAMNHLNKFGEDLSYINSNNMEYPKYKYVVDTQLRLASSFNSRSLVNGDGYFKVKNGSGKYDVVENFREIENRNTLSSEKYTPEDIEQEKKDLLRKWNASRY